MSNKLLDSLKNQDQYKAEAFDAISNALDDYHLALLNRKHGGLAVDTFVNAVELAMGRGGFIANEPRLRRKERLKKDD